MPAGGIGRRWVVSALLLAASLAAVHAAAYSKTPKSVREKDARRAISTMTGLDLKENSVKVKNISAVDASAPEVTATVRTAFHFRKIGEGQNSRWSLVELRTGERRWDELDLILRALKIPAARPSIVADLETLAAQLEAEQRARQQKKKRAESERENEPAAGDEHDRPSRQRRAEESEAAQQTGTASAEKTDAVSAEKTDAASAETEDLRLGIFTAKSFSALHKSATLEAEVEGVFRLAREAGKGWRVVEFRLGETGWQNPAGLTTAIDSEKRERARRDLEIIRAALEAFRRERGFYVVTDDFTVLTDHLSPRYLQPLIRLDPWDRPFRYTGGRDLYRLASDGADGKEGTADDLTLGSGR